MNKDTQKNLDILKNKKVGIFFDDANIFYAAVKNKWKISIYKFKEFFTNYCDLIFFNYYVSLPEKKDGAYLKSFKFINSIDKIVTIKQKTIKYIFNGEHFIKKANFDIEICLDVVRNIDYLDVIIVVSGDSDFFELKKYVFERNRDIIFICYSNNMSFELKQGRYILFEQIREFVELKKS